MNYTTQMDAARKGIITKELQAVAEKRADGYSAVNAAGGRGKVAIPAKQKPQMPGSKRYRLHVKDQDQCKPGNFQRLQRPGYGASESK